MISHFKAFWADPSSIQKSINRIKLAVKLRSQEVTDSFSKNPETSTERMTEFKDIMEDVYKSTDDLAVKLHSLMIDDFVFGFHAAPDASVGHLHMHVLSAPSEFRRYSTMAHDWKTIPANAVMDVIRAEQR